MCIMCIIIMCIICITCNTCSISNTSTQCETSAHCAQHSAVLFHYCSDSNRKGRKIQDIAPVNCGFSRSVQRLWKFIRILASLNQFQLIVANTALVSTEVNFSWSLPLLRLAIVGEEEEEEKVAEKEEVELVVGELANCCLVSSFTLWALKKLTLQINRLEMINIETGRQY